MNIPITTRGGAAIPTSGEGTLFLDSANQNALTVKYSDCTYKVLSGEPVQFSVAQPLTDFINDSMSNLSCAAAKGIYPLSDLQTYINSINLYYTSNIDASGNLTQSITTTAPATTSNDTFTTGLISPSNASGSGMALAYTSPTPATTDNAIIIDRDGIDGDIAVSLVIPAGVSGLTLLGESFVSNSVGAVTSYANMIKEGSSSYSGEFTYDGTEITAGTYVAVIVLVSSTVTKYIPVTIVISK